VNAEGLACVSCGEALVVGRAMAACKACRDTLCNACGPFSAGMGVSDKGFCKCGKPPKGYTVPRPGHACSVCGAALAVGSTMAACKACGDTLCRGCGHPSAFSAAQPQVGPQENNKRVIKRRKLTVEGLETFGRFTVCLFVLVRVILLLNPAVAAARLGRSLSPSLSLSCVASLPHRRHSAKRPAAAPPPCTPFARTSTSTTRPPATAAAAAARSGSARAERRSKSTPFPKVSSTCTSSRCRPKATSKHPLLELPWPNQAHLPLSRKLEYS